MMKSRQLIKTAALSVSALLITAATQANGATVEPNILALYAAQGTSTTATSYTLSNLTVTGILNTTATKTTFVVSDGTGSLLYYSIATTALPTPTVGETISSITSTDSPYQGGQELTTATALGTTATGTAPTPPVITVPQFVAAGGLIPAVPPATPASEGPTLGIPPYAEAIVTLDGVTLSGGTAPTAAGIATNVTYTLTDSLGNTTSLYAYASDSAVKAAAAAFTSYGTYNITGYVDDYYGATEIYPLFATPVSSVTAVPLPKSMPAATAGLLLVGGSAIVRRRRTA